MILIKFFTLITSIFCSVLKNGSAINRLDILKSSDKLGKRGPNLSCIGSNKIYTADKLFLDLQELYDQVQETFSQIRLENPMGIGTITTPEILKVFKERYLDLQKSWLRIIESADTSRNHEEEISVLFVKILEIKTSLVVNILYVIIVETF